MVVDADSLQAPTVEGAYVRRCWPPGLQEDGVVGSGLIEDVTIGQCTLRQVSIRAADEEVRLANWRRHDPFAGRCLGRLRPYAGDYVGIVVRVREIDGGAQPGC